MLRLPSISLVLLSVALPLAAADVIQTKTGPVTGTTSADGKIHIYKGIPYAAPPVGELRWKAPQAPTPWPEPLAANAFGARCMQGAIFTDMVFRDPGPSEDCLKLNVWTPALSAKAKLPVMVWIYGGGFAAGASSEPRQDGEMLAHKDVIVVSMNYRLGVFGFFVHGDLAKESPQHASGNYGLLDQVAALQWVHNNIEAFGGDPGNVTIFGESAGSFSVSGLMASPLSKSLITRAIGESGALFGRGLQRGSMAEADEDDRKFAREQLGTDSLPALRAKPAADLLAASLKARNQVRFSTCIDGYFLPESVANIYASGRQAHVPLLAGWNADEMGPGAIFGKGEKTAAAYKTWVEKQFGDNAGKVLEVYPGESDEQALKSAGALAGDQFIAYSTWKWIEMQGTTGESPVWRYRFEDAPPMTDGSTHGAYHSAEIEFVFEQLNSKKLPWRASDLKLSSQISSYWTNFAKTGDPNGTGLPLWPAYKSETGYQVMHLNDAPAAAPATDKGRYEVMDKLPPPRT